MQVYKAINAVQADLAKSGITKDRFNGQGSGYKFRGIDAYPSYLFSECGGVWSKRSKRFLSPLNTQNGYVHCVLVESGVKYRHAIHRLIARAFHGAQDFDAAVNHKNGDKSDNRACNLEWTTQSENVKHSYATGLRTINAAHRAMAAELGRCKRTVSNEQIRQMRSMFSGVRGDIERISKALGVSRYIVSYHVNGVKNASL